MKSYSAYFVRNAKVENAQAMFAQVETLADSAWLICAFRSDDEAPEDEVLFGEKSLTLAKSEQLGEVIFVYGDTSTDGFVYEHACDGKLLRKLVWFQLLDDDWNSGWVCVEGEPEAWEATLFRAEMLTRYLENERQNLADAGWNEEIEPHLSEIKQLWSQGRIVAGKTFPECDGAVALLVEQSYGIKRTI